MLSSDHVLQVDQVPTRVAVIGGGAIGCEFASFLVDVGAEVTMLEALPQVLAGVDQQVAQTVVRAFTKRGIKVADRREDRGPRPGLVRISACASRARPARRRSSVDQVVVSVGRRPRSEGIGLEDAGVKVDERGFVAVDGNLRTNVDGVYAVGDVVATPQLAHVAFSEAIVAIKTHARRGARCRSTTTRCRGASTAIPRSRSAGSPKPRRPNAATTSRRRCTGGVGNGRALIVGETDGMVKIVAERDGPILGVHIAGPVGDGVDRRGVPVGELGSDGRPTSAC